MSECVNISSINKLKLLFYKFFCSSKSYEKHKIKYSIPNYQAIEHPKLIMVLSAKNEDDIIAQNLEFHKAMGVDGFIITDNNSTDNTLKILQSYKKKGWILDIISETSEEYKQAEFVDRMIKLAIEKYHADWIICADADEFWRSKSGNLKFELSKSKANLIYVPIYNMLDNHEYWLDNTTIIKKSLPRKRENQLQIEQKLGKYHQFSRQIPKVIVRADQYVHVHNGNHSADMKVQHVKIQSDDIYIYHYNSRGKAKFIANLEKGKALQYDVQKKQGVHWHYFYELSQTNTNMNLEYQKYTGTLCLADVVNITEKDTFVADFFKLREISAKFPKIMDFKEMLDQIKNGASMARFGDAEFDIAMQRNKDDPYQKPSDELSARLLSILKTPCSKQLLVCIPPFNSLHNNIKNFRDGLSFWEWYWKDRYDTLSQLFVNDVYGNSFFSRDAVFYELDLEEIKQIWNNKNVVFVISPDGRFIFDDRLFDNIKSKYEVHVPATSAFSEYSRILSECLQYPKDTLFFAAAGPTATVLAAELSNNGYQCLDMGHFSNCYLQYLGEARSPEHLPMVKNKKKRKHKNVFFN